VRLLPASPIRLECPLHRCSSFRPSSLRSLQMGSDRVKVPDPLAGRFTPVLRSHPHWSRGARSTLPRARSPGARAERLSVEGQALMKRRAVAGVRTHPQLPDKQADPSYPRLWITVCVTRQEWWCHA
jgi:hypothetical protein